MSKQILFSAFLVATFLVAPIASTATFNSTPARLARADTASISSTSLASTSSQSSSLSSSSLSLSSSFSSVSVSSSLTVSSILQDSSSSTSSSSVSNLVTKKIKSYNEVKPVKLAPAAVNFWLDTDVATGGNSNIVGIEATNAQIQSKLQSLCPNIYDTNTKIINENNLANCAPINNLPIQKLGIIDSGVNATAEMLPFMDQANSWNYFTSVNNPSCTATSTNPISFGQVGSVNPVYYCKQKGTQTDTDYHGTAVTYTAIQTFKNSLLKNRIKIIPVSLRTLDTINISDSIDQLTADGVKTINLSLGTPFNVSYVETSINDANLAGVEIYSASGNCAIYTASNCDYNGNTIQDLPQEVDNAPDYPAAYLNGTMVGSSNYSENNLAGVIRSTYSNYPAAIKSRFLTAPVGNQGIVLPCFLNCGGVTSYGYLGTSFSAPQAAGVNALVNKYTTLMKQNLNQPNEKVLVATDTADMYINNNASDILSAGNDIQTGNGILNLKKISDKIITQLQTFNITTTSSSVLASSSAVVQSSVVSSSSAQPSSIVALSSIATVPSSTQVVNPISSAILISSTAASSMVAKNTMINSITLNPDSSSYIVAVTSNFSPVFGDDHIHFYYNTESNTVMNKMFGGPSPYTLPVSGRPANATQLCIIVGTASHAIIPNTGNCVALPAIVVPVSSSSIVTSSSNVSSSTNTNTVSSSSTQASPASSSQISSSSQAVSSSSTQVSSAIVSSSSQNSSSVVSNPSNSSGGGVISIITTVIGNLINSLTGVNGNLSGNTASISSASSVISSSSSVSLQTAGSADPKNLPTPVKTDIAIKEQGVRLLEELAFAGLVNNPNGVTPALQSDFAIKEQGVKAPESQTENKNEYGIKEQGIKASVKTSSSSQAANDECKKGWDGSVKGGNIAADQKSTDQPTRNPGGQVVGNSKEQSLNCNQNPSKCEDAIAEGAITGKLDAGNSASFTVVKTQTARESNQQCNPIVANPQSEIKSASNLSQYIPIVLVAIVGIAGAITAVNFFIKLKGGDLN